MPDNHRGTPIAGNHRPTPRLQQAIARQLQKDVGGFGSDNARTAGYVIQAHRAGEPIKSLGSIPTGPVFTDALPYVGWKEFSEVMDRVGPGAYDHGRDDAWSDEADMRNRVHETNRAVRNEGGTSGYIGKAVKNRKGSSDEDDF
jgi:hypothetical protein